MKIICAEFVFEEAKYKIYNEVTWNFLFLKFFMNPILSAHKSSFSFGIFKKSQRS